MRAAQRLPTTLAFELQEIPLDAAGYGWRHAGPS
jgi:hypothetical protein